MVNQSSLGADEFVESSWVDKPGHLSLEASLYLRMIREQPQITFYLLVIVVCIELQTYE